MKKTIIILIIVILVGIGAYFLIKGFSGEEVIPEASPTPTPTATPQANAGQTVIGKSVANRDIIAYHYGTGNTELLFIGGSHGGYEWNTVLVAHELMDYLKANPSIIPKNVKVTVIPVLNPDGLSKVVGTADRFSKSDVSTSEATVISGRFNDNNVDLNRNFDCDWKASGVWQDRTVSGGTKAFSEPESLALKTYVEKSKPEAVVAWYSSAGGVFASNCHNGILADTRTLLNTFAKASGYRAYESYDFYKITGDMVNWLAKNNIPAISVLLTTHEDTEWTKNKAGIDAVLKQYAE
ncbi:hypothetical protein KW782_04875 [Candidatus Parcubacteria bacterium]|nr:hypothetical protein [Candidatus Parcubacteria bacterium]